MGPDDLAVHHSSPGGPGGLGHLCGLGEVMICHLCDRVLGGRPVDVDSRLMHLGCVPQAYLVVWYGEDGEMSKRRAH